MAQGSSRPKLRPLDTAEPKPQDEALPVRVDQLHRDLEDVKELLLQLIEEVRRGRASED